GISRAAARSTATTGGIPYGRSRSSRHRRGKMASRPGSYRSRIRIPERESGAIARSSGPDRLPGRARRTAAAMGTEALCAVGPGAVGNAGATATLAGGSDDYRGGVAIVPGLGGVDCRGEARRGQLGGPRTREETGAQAGAHRAQDSGAVLETGAH